MFDGGLRRNAGGRACSVLAGGALASCGALFHKKTFSDFFADPAGLAHVNSYLFSYLQYSLIKTLLRLIRLWVSLVIGLQTSSNGDETTIKLLTDAETRPLDTTTRGADVRSERGDRFRSTKRRANRAETLDAGRVARGRAELISDRSPEKKRAPLGENQKRDHDGHAQAPRAPERRRAQEVRLHRFRRHQLDGRRRGAAQAAPIHGVSKPSTHASTLTRRRIVVSSSNLFFVRVQPLTAFTHPRRSVAGRRASRRRPRWSKRG